MSRRVPRLPGSVYLLAVTSFFADVSTEMLYPVLPLFLTEELRAPRTAVGIVEGVAEATQNVVQGGSGWIADRMRRNKPIAVAGYALAALAKPTIGLATAWPSVLASRFGDRLGAGLRSAPRDALIAGSVDDARRGAAFGLEGVGDNLGAVVGPLLAAGLLYLLDVPLRSIFLLAFVPAALAVVLIASVRETGPERPAPRTRVALSALPPAYRRYLVPVAVFGLGNVSSAFIVLKAAEVGVPAELVILVYAGYNLAAALASYPAGRLSDAWGRARVMLATLALFVLAFGGLAVATNGVLVAVLFALYGVHRGAVRAAGKALAVDLAPVELRASSVGLYSAVLGLTAFVASAAAGVLWDRVGSATMFALAAGIGLVATLLFALLVPLRAAGSGAPSARR